MTSHTEMLESAMPPGPALADRPWRWLPVRTLGQHHRDRLSKHLLALDAQDRHLRFGYVVSDEQIDGYVQQLDFERDKLLGVFDERLHLVAMAHLAFEGDGGTAEFGVSVHPHLRSKGFGGRLFRHAIRHARNRGAHSMAVHLARENAPMLNIVRRVGAQVSFDGADATAQLELPADNLGTQLEAMIEGQAANLDYRLKLQVLRLDRLWPHLLHPGRKEA